MPFSFIVTSPSLRINSTVILILSSINFKISVTTRLPIVSYLTILDKYAFPALIFMDCLCFYHSIIGSSLFAHTNLSILEHYDGCCLIFFGILFSLFHISYISFFVKTEIKSIVEEPCLTDTLDPAHIYT